MNQSEHTPESATKGEVPGFPLRNSICGEGSSSQAPNAPTQNGFISKGKEVLQVGPMKVRRNMIDLQLPAHGEKLLLASRQNGYPRSSLAMKNPNGLIDLNEPVQCQELVHVPSSRDAYYLHERNNLHAQRRWLEQNTSQNGWMVQQAGHRKIIPSHKFCLPSPSGQVMGYPSTNHRVLPGERASFEWEGRQRHPQVSYNGYMESSVPSNGLSSSHGYLPHSVRPWSHWISPWKNPSNISVQNSLAHQTNPFLNFTSQARAGSSSEVRSRSFDGRYQGFSSGSKGSAFSFPSGNFNHLNNGLNGAVTNGYLPHRSFQNFQEPKKLECVLGLPWIKPKPPNRNEITNGGLDLNTSANQLRDGSVTGDGSNYPSPHNGLRSVSCSNDANLGQLEMADSQNITKMIEVPINQKHRSLNPSSVCITEQLRVVKAFAKRNVDINLPCEASVSEALVVNKEGCENSATDSHYIDLNLCPSEDENSGLCSNPRVEMNATTLIDLEAPPALETGKEQENIPKKKDETTLGSLEGEARDSVEDLIKAAAEAIVTISFSLSYPCRDTDEAASSSTDSVANEPLSWFVNTIASCGNEIDACLEAKDSQGCREEGSSGEFDYFEAKTLNLPQTKEEDYMPKPLVPYNLNFNGTGSMGITANRPRREHTRRGRPRRDFQRDILPRLPSLSRLEVTEDLQLFEGLLKSTSYNWNTGEARRSSNQGESNRGRKRLVRNIDRAPVCSTSAQPINNNSIQMVGQEDRSLTGWGNATRRSKRQRSPAGTPPTATVILK